MAGLFGADDTLALVGRTARLIGLQFYDDMAQAVGVSQRTPVHFAELVAALQRAQGETIELGMQGPIAVLRQAGWRLMQGVADAPSTGFAAWNELILGMAAAHDRFMTVQTIHQDDVTLWRFTPG
jgi:hypothetical protein